MAIFDGRYSWNGKKEDHRDPIAWFPGAYDLKIIDLREEHRGVSFLKPYICIFTNTGFGHSVSANPEKFAKRICVDFSLDLEKVLWVECLSVEPLFFEIVLFNRNGQLHEKAIYLVSRRQPTHGEASLIKREFAKKQ